MLFFQTVRQMVANLDFHYMWTSSVERDPYRVVCIGVVVCLHGLLVELAVFELVVGLGTLPKVLVYGHYH